MSALTDIFDAIANAIRAKNGSSDTYTPAQMVEAIKAIPSAEYDTPTPVSSLSDAFDKIADAIRSKLGSQDTFTPSEMPDAIASIPVSSGNIYGIRRSTSSTSSAWERTDDAVGATFSASVGSTAGSSSFDEFYPWSEIQRETIGQDVFVKIPKFWFKRYIDNGYEYIKIADHAEQGFTLHPAFTMGDIQRDYIYVGAYTGSANYRSETGVAPLNNVDRATIRTNIHNKGDGYHIWSLSALNAIKLLILVEIANYDSQTMIGRGVCNNSTFINNGSCDNVPNLTGVPSGETDKVGVIWRGIENLWGNLFQYIDGIMYSSIDPSGTYTKGEYYVCNNPEYFYDNTNRYNEAPSEQYRLLGYAPNPNRGKILQLGMDNIDSSILLPELLDSTNTTPIPDYTMVQVQVIDEGHSYSWWMPLSGGMYSHGDNAGLFASFAGFETPEDPYYSRNRWITCTYRMMYLPPVS